MPKKPATIAPSVAKPASIIGWRWVTVVLMAGVFMFGCFVGNAPISSTEGHRALVGHQMLQKGEYLITTIYGRLYQTKPPLQPLTIALSEHLLGGPSEFAWRLPSVLGAALMAAFLALMSDRWFGRPAGLVAGFCSLGMVVLWEQNRTADIDSMNTLVSVVAACCLIELIINRPRRPIVWMLLGGLTLGASLLYKGPAGMPVIGGALLGSIFTAIYFGSKSVLSNPIPAHDPLAPAASPAYKNADAPISKATVSPAHVSEATDPLSARWDWLKRPWFVGALLIGGGLFAWVMLAIKAEMARRGLSPDTTGLEEAGRRMLVTDFPTLLKALLVPLTLIVFSMPVSFLAGYAIFTRKGWNSADPKQRTLIRTLVFSLLGAFVIGIIAGITNYRYGYVSLPLLCPLAAAAYKVHEPFLSTAKGQKVSRLLLFILGMVFLVAFVFFAIVSLRDHADSRVMIIAFMLVMMGLSMLIRGQDTAWRVRGLCILMLILAVPFAFWKNNESQRKSAKIAIDLALKKKLPTGTPVTVGRMLLTQPELFYYGQFVVNSYGDTLKEPVQLNRSQWILFNKEEYTNWKQAYGGQFVEVIDLHTARHTSYLVWLDPSLPAQSPATQPVTRPALGPAREPVTRPSTGSVIQPATRPATGPATLPASLP